MMRRLQMRSILLAAGFVAATAFCSTGCGEGIDVPNAAAEVSQVGDPDGDDATDIERVDASLSIPYLIRDREGDDQRLLVEICTLTAEGIDRCGVAVQGPGGDGANFVPTTPAGTNLLHVFHWNVGCGRFVNTQRVQAAPDEPLVAQISVVDSDAEPARSAQFTLDEVGFDALPDCD